MAGLDARIYTAQLAELCGSQWTRAERVRVVRVKVEKGHEEEEEAETGKITTQERPSAVSGNGDSRHERLYSGTEPITSEVVRLISPFPS